MNKIKRILSIIISVVMVMSLLCINVTAEETEELTAQQQDAVKKIALLAKLEIFDYEYEWDETMYRIDFAQAMSRLINCPVNGYQVKDLYDDVKDGDPGYGEVSVMYDMDIMNGKGNRIFAPNELITVPEAITAMVRLLGYTAKAQAKGGYPGGYTLTATDLGLLKNVSYEGCDEGITAGALAEIIYNALDVEMVDSYILDNSGIKVTGSGKRTILESYLGLKKGEGLVTASGIISLTTPLDTALLPEEVKINDETYNHEYDTMNDFLGYDVEYFYREKTGGEAYSTVLFASKKTNAKEATVYSDDIDTADSKNIKTKKNSGGKTYKIASEPTIIKNGIFVSKMQDSEIPENGYVKMISNNGSNYDVIMIFDFQSFVVASNSKGKITFRYSLGLDGMNLVDLNDSDKMSYVLYENEAVKPEDIKKDDIVSIAYHKNWGYYVIISRETVSGGITMTKDNPFRVSIDGDDENMYDVNEKFHQLSDNSVDDTEPLAVGKSTTFMLDFMNKICGMGEIESEIYYGYLYGAKNGGALSDDYEVRLFSNEKSGWNDYKLAEKCSLNGVRTANDAIITNLKNYITEMDSKLHHNASTGEIDDVYPPIVKFEVNIKGEIKNIVNNLYEGNDPSKIEDNTIVLSKPYWKTVFQFGYDYFTSYANGAREDRHIENGKGPTAFGGDAVCIKIPSDKEKTTEFAVGTPYNVLPKDYNQPRPYMFYDLDEFGVPGLILYLPAGGGSKIQTQTKVYGVVDVGSGADCKVLYLIDSSGNESKYFTTEDSEVVEQCEKLKKGDFIQISLDTDNKLIAVAEFFSYDVSKFNPDDYKSGGKFYQRMKDTSSQEGVGIGFFKAMKSKYVNSTTGTQNSGKVIRFYGSAKDYSMIKAEKILIFDGEEYTVGTVDEIVDGDYLLGRASGADLSDVYVFRNSGFTNEEVYLVNKQE